MTGRPGRSRAVLGIAVTVQSVGLLLLTVFLTSLVTLAVLSWLERST